MSKVQVNTYTDQSGKGAPNLPHGAVISGVLTATSTKQTVNGNVTVSGNVGISGTITYEDATDIDSVGIVTARSGINVSGGNVTVGSGNINVSSGSVSATSFTGDGSNLTGVSGFSTALGNTQGTLENLIFKTTESFTVAAGTSVRIESDNTSGNTAFTRLSRINVATGATFHVSAGTTFIMNVLSVF